MAGKRNTWWVSYLFEYSYYDSEEKEWFEESDFDAGRFYCLKKDIPKEEIQVKLSAIGRFYLMRYQEGKTNVPDKYMREIMAYMEWEEKNKIEVE